MRQPVKAILFACALVVAVLTVFQNCAPSTEEATDNGSLSDTLPFAYDTALDTLAYMSCAGGPQASEPEAIWTFRAGAFNSQTSGIRLTEAYLNATSQFSVPQRAAALGQSTRNANTRLQFAMRSYENLSGPYTLTGTAQEGVSYSNMLGATLDNPAIAELISNVTLGAPTRFMYFPGFTGINGLKGRRIEGALRFLQDEASAAGVRSALHGVARLTATYSFEADSYLPRTPTPANPLTQAYGRGYQLGFVNLDAVSVALGSVVEYNLDPASTGEVRPWTCPADMRFRVVKTCGGSCACTNDPPTGADLRMNTVREVLKTEHWYVDTNQNCVVQKGPQQACYAATAPTEHHFVSICIRQ